MKAKIESLLKEHGYSDFKWIRPREIVVSQWVRMKCIFGCDEYGRNAACPPNVPSVSDCRKFFDEYEAAVVLHFEKHLEDPESRHRWSQGINENLLKLEKRVFVAGYEKTFLLFMDSCSFCSDCPSTRGECNRPKSARPSPEALAVDVFSTVRKVDYPIEVLNDYDCTMNRYAFLLIR
jgi:predicted metal-binding protein